MIGPGSQLAHYEVVSALGKGGMGEVWRARDTKLGREVAIKTLPPEFAQDTDRLARFEREAKLLASLNHPNIAAIYGFEEHQGSRFLVLELVEGDTLAHRLKRGAIPVEGSVKLALQIAEALEAAHEKGVIHRDLKPANIKITDDDKVKVLDFGLAKAFEADTTETGLSNSPTLSMAATQAGVILGTVAYMSPEQAKGKTTDKRADVWAFGCVLYEMLTGWPAFSGDDVSDILASVLKTDPDWNALPDDLHWRLRELLERCLRRDRTLRYRDIGDVNLDLQSVESDPHGVLSGATNTGAREHASRLGWVAPFAAGVLIAGVAAWMMRGAPDPNQVRRFSEPGPSVLRTSDVFEVSPNGRFLVYTGPDGLYLRDMSIGETRLLPDTSGRGQNIAFSPDSEEIAYLRSDNFTSGDGSITIQKINIVDDRTTRLTPVESGGNLFGGPTWGPDGTVVYSQPDGIWSVPATGGTPSQLLPAEDGEQIYSPQVLPGGDAVLFVSTMNPLTPQRWAEARVFVHSFDTDVRTELARGGSDVRYLPESGHLLYAEGTVLRARPFDPARMDAPGDWVSVVSGVRRDINSSGDPADSQYSVSSDGMLVYSPGGGEVGPGIRALMWVDLEGTETPLELSPGSYTHPRVSPDGTRIAYVSDFQSPDSNVWVYNVSERQTPLQMPSPSEGGNRYVIWSPDSSFLAFQSDREGDRGIWRQRADRSAPAERLTMAAGGEEHVPDSFSRDGRTLSFTVHSGNESTVWTLDLETEEGLVFAEIPGVQLTQSAFSPAGPWIAYQARSGGNSGIYVAPFPRAEAEPYLLTDPREGVRLLHHPMWSPEGRELFYTPYQQGAVVSVITEPAVAFENPRSLRINLDTGNPGTVRQFDIHPDGDRFIVSPDPTVGAQVTLNFITNWLTELNELVPTE